MDNRLLGMGPLLFVAKQEECPMGLLVTLRWAEAGALALRGAGEKCSLCRVIGVHFAP
jgi:hypothetical protein